MNENNRLIVVDDEPGIIEAYRSMLNAKQPEGGIQSSRQKNALSITRDPAPAPFEVKYVMSGEEAIAEVSEKFHAGTPYLGGFFDVKLGAGIDGLETIRRIKGMDPNFLCVIVTAYQDRTVEEIRKLLGDEYTSNWDIMTKPFFRIEILQKAFNLCSNWNDRQNVRERLHILNSKIEKQAELVRQVIEVIGNKILGKAEFGLTKHDPEEVRLALKSIQTDATQLRNAIVKLQHLSKEEEKKKAA
jgi:two-component system, NtrC family, sensor kinase